MVALFRANEKFLQRQQGEEGHRAKQEESRGRYVADDSDLPEIFFRPTE